MLEDVRVCRRVAIEIFLAAFDVREMFLCVRTQDDLVVDGSGLGPGNGQFSLGAQLFQRLADARRPLGMASRCVARALLVSYNCHADNLTLRVWTLQLEIGFSLPDPFSTFNREWRRFFFDKAVSAGGRMMRLVVLLPGVLSFYPLPDAFKVGWKEAGASAGRGCPDDAGGVGAVRRESFRHGQAS